MQCGGIRARVQEREMLEEPAHSRRIPVRAGGAVHAITDEADGAQAADDPVRDGMIREIGHQPPGEQRTRAPRRRETTGAAHQREAAYEAAQLDEIAGPTGKQEPGLSPPTLWHTISSSCT